MGNLILRWVYNCSENSCIDCNSSIVNDFPKAIKWLAQSIVMNPLTSILPIKFLTAAVFL